MTPIVSAAMMRLSGYFGAIAFAFSRERKRTRASGASFVLTFSAY
jgi:hypothetical protein